MKTIRVGDRIRLIAMPDDPDPVPRGSTGTVKCDDRGRIDQALEQIARAELRIPTLRERKSDGLDFHDLGVWSLKRALLAAYQAGRNDAK